jgi:hypothetical protein
MLLFALGIEHALDAAVQRSHDANPRGLAIAIFAAVALSAVVGGHQPNFTPRPTATPQII